MFAIRDLQTGSDIISRISLANPIEARADLERVLDSLQATPPDADTYFRLLEHARVSVSFVAEELAKRYINKPLPLGEIEEALFQGVVTLWAKMAKAYAQCAARDSGSESDPGHLRRVATILQRCIHYTGTAILEHHRARRELAWGLWLDLHGYFASAEEWDVATLTVIDPLEVLGRNTHCTASYLSFILCDMAGPYSLSVRDQMLVRRWAAYWSPLVTLHSAHPGDSLPQFVIDLMQDIALRPVAECLQTDQLRRIDTSRLALQIAQIRQQLAQRVAPAQLSLGDDCTTGQCNRLLTHLARPWSQVRAQRKYRRHATSGVTKLCVGFDEMHYFIAGKVFEQPDNVRTYSRREFDSLFAFRFQENPQQMLQIKHEQLTYSVDAWEVVNQSANGFRLVRSVSGKKMMHEQLIALCPHDGDRFILVESTWLMQERGGGLIAGIRAFPGLPVAIAARLLESPGPGVVLPPGTESGKYQRAFMLPEVPAVDSAQSLILPTGWFRPGRTVEIYTDGVWRVRLTGIIEDGADFERVGFEIC